MTGRHGCFDREPMKPGYWHAGRTMKRLDSGSPILGHNEKPLQEDIGVWITHRMSTDCQHTKHDPADPKCHGCRWQRVTESAG